MHRYTFLALNKFAHFLFWFVLLLDSNNHRLLREIANRNFIEFISIKTFIHANGMLKYLLIILSVCQQQQFASCFTSKYGGHNARQHLMNLKKMVSCVIVLSVCVNFFLSVGFVLVSFFMFWSLSVKKQIIIRPLKMRNIPKTYVECDAHFKVVTVQLTTITTRTFFERFIKRVRVINFDGNLHLFINP